MLNQRSTPEGAKVKRVQHDEVIEEEGKKRVIRVFRVVRDQRIREFKVQSLRFNSHSHRHRHSQSHRQ